MNDQPSSDGTEFFAAPGQLTVAWGYIELGIDFITTTLHQDFGGHLIEQESPWALQRKLKFIRKCARKMSPSQDLTEMFTSITQDVADASVIRHDLIHGVMVQYPFTSKEVKLVRLLRGANRPTQKKIETSVQETQTKIAELVALAKRVIRTALWLADALASIENGEKS